MSRTIHFHLSLCTKMYKNLFLLVKIMYNILKCLYFIQKLIFISQHCLFNFIYDFFSVKI